MAISVLSAAKRLGKKSNWSLSNLEMQKILYLAHMFFMGRNNGEPLIRGNFEAWDYGPVHPDLYHRVKIFGSDDVQDIFPNIEPPAKGSREREIIDEAYENLGDLGPGRLVNATHQPNGAWDQNYLPGKRHIIIPNEDILREYRELG